MGGQGCADDVLRRFLRLSGRLGLPQFAGGGLTASEVAALVELAGGAALSQRELGERLGLEKSTVSRLAAGLEARGCLRRVREPADRRLYRVRLTARGRELAARAVAAGDAHRRALLAALTDAELAALTTGLTALTRALDQTTADRPDHG